ncbi:MAG: radical SAM protein [Thermodesulfobacteriota bacterium]|nr:radical SAM protein [Thermodesulfobacteriota bacterium]
MKTLSAPLIVSIQVTTNCNCSCTYCYNANAGYSKTMSLSDFQHVVEIFAEKEIFNFVIEGGEPMLHPQLQGLVQIIEDTGIEYTLITNGTMIDTYMAQWLSRLNCDLIISLDGLTQSVHNRTRSRYESAIKGINNLISYGVSFGINTVLNRHNIKSYPDIIERLYPQVKRFALLRLVPRSADDDVVKDLLAYSLSEVECLENELRNLCQMKPDIRIDSPFNLSGNKSNGFCESLEVPGCLAGTTLLTVRPNLDVLPCSYCQGNVIGNLKLQTFHEIWESESTKEIQAATIPPCLKRM